MYGADVTRSKSIYTVLALAAGLWLAAGCSDDGPSPDTGPGSEDTPTACKDGKDNDGDGKTDCDDPGCAQLVFCRKDGGFDGEQFVGFDVRQ